jgi:hypothetical protein
MNIDQGQEIVYILPRLIDEIGDIASLNLLALDTASQSNRVVDRPELKPVVAEALHIRKEYKVPFWEAVLLTARKEKGEALDLVLDEATHHRPMSEVAENIQINAEDFFVGKLQGIAARADGRHIVALSSKVTTKGSQEAGHLQMLDFRIRPNEENESLAAEILKRVGVGGVLLNSGNSYHFYGYHLMRSDAELSRFLGKVSLFAPFVDQRWVAHQMIEGACALRVSKGKSFTHSPVFVRYVDAD